MTDCSCPLRSPDDVATGRDFYNGAHANKQALDVALDALRKIRIGYPCDVHGLIAAYAVEEIEALTSPPKRRDLEGVGG